MNVKELIQNIEYSSIHETILRLYPGERKRVEEGYYKLLWEELKRTYPAENQNHMTIHVQYVKEHEKSDKYMWNVTYSIDRRYHHQYGLQFLRKEEILSAIVLEGDLKDQSAEEYLVHILFDIAREGQMEDVDDEIQCVEPKAHLPHFAEQSAC